MMIVIGAKTAAIHAVATVLISSILIQIVVATKIDLNNSEVYVSEAKIKTLPGSSNHDSGTSIIIQAEDFINAYDSTAGNSGNACRPSMNVDLELTTDTGGGVSIGRIVEGEWLVYDVNIPVAGKYKVSYRVASTNGIGRIQLESAGGGSIYGFINVPVTGGMQKWITITHIVGLPGGQQRIGLVFIKGNFNLNWIRIDASFTLPGSNGTSIMIQAEDFIDARDTTAGNSGNACRPSLDVDLYRSTDIGGGVNVGWIAAGEWLVYDVNISVAGSYQVSYRVQSPRGTGSILLQNAGGGTIYGSIDVPVTGVIDKWVIISHVVVLPAGKQNIALVFKAGNFNLNWIQIDRYEIIPGHYRLLNYWKRDLSMVINIEKGPLVASNVPAQFHSSHWNLAPVSGTLFMRLTNRKQPSRVLTIQRGKLLAVSAEISDQSSHWELMQRSVESSTVFHLKNRFLPTQYIHFEYGILQVGNIMATPGWHSSVWFLKPV